MARAASAWPPPSRGPPALASTVIPAAAAVQVPPAAPFAANAASEADRRGQEAEDVGMGEDELADQQGAGAAATMAGRATGCPPTTIAEYFRLDLSEEENDGTNDEEGEDPDDCALADAARKALLPALRSAGMTDLTLGGIKILRLGRGSLVVDYETEVGEAAPGSADVAAAADGGLVQWTV